MEAGPRFGSSLEISHPAALHFRLPGVLAQSLVPRARADAALVPSTPKAKSFRCGETFVRWESAARTRREVTCEGRAGGPGGRSASDSARGRGLPWAAPPSARLPAPWPGDSVRPSLVGSVTGFEARRMGTLPGRKDIPPWVKVPADLKDPEVLQVQTQLLEAMFGE